MLEFHALGEVARVTLQLLPQLLVPEGAGLLFWGVLIFIYWQARRVAHLERSLYGRELNPPLRRVFTAAVYGLAAGIVGSLAVTLLGVSLGPLDIAYLWPLALALLLFDPRLLCFAYAGGILALARLLVGWPPIHVGGVLGLVAVMHLVEGVLVAIDSEKLITPVWVRSRNDGTVGGFLVQRFWPVPLVVVFFLPGVSPPGGISMPGWWPLVTPGPAHLAANALFVLIPVAAALGYADIALTRPARRKSRLTAGLLLIYSAVLLGLAIAGSHYPLALWAAALFAPGAHEWLARHGGASEVAGRPAFAAPARGAGVLDVIPGSPAEAVGLESGDVVLAVNGRPVQGRRELTAALETAPIFLSLDVTGPRGRRELEWNRYRGGAADFGVVPVPEPDDPPHADITRRRGPAVLRWLRRLFARRPPA